MYTNFLKNLKKIDFPVNYLKRELYVHLYTAIILDLLYFELDATIVNLPLG